MLLQAVFNTSKICHELGVHHAVLSPGSRNAPLTISFSRNDDIQKWIIPDERSAGFIALGIAQELNEPVVLCCTSGTALLNYAPAIAEAFYRQIPLIVLSADRPPELIDQRDGQTIRQFDVLKNHVKASVQLPVVESDRTGLHYQEQVINTIHQARTLPEGPVHLNIPFREPFYPDPSAVLRFDEITVDPPAVSTLEESFELPVCQKILLLIGKVSRHLHCVMRSISWPGTFLSLNHPLTTWSWGSNM